MAATRGGGRRALPRGMTFCTLRRGRESVLGVRTPRGILDVPRAAKLLRREAPATMEELLRDGGAGSLRALVDAALTRPSARAAFVDERRAAFGPCVGHPEKILCLGFNYRQHAQETSAPVPTSPLLFSKFANALAGHGSAIPLPVGVASQFDYEAELVIVMGRTAHRVSEADALSFVLGYCVGNDLSARDLQFKTSQFLLGKTCDGFAPVGPWLVTADQVDPSDLAIECRVNGELRQSARTSDMVFDCRAVVSYASRHMTLRPGDLIFTGTPEGVVLGQPRERQRWLVPGDQVTTSIEKLGELRFTLAAEPA